MSTLSREYIRDAHWLNTVLIEMDGLSPLESHLTPEQKTVLFLAGYDTTRTFLPIKLARLARRTGLAEVREDVHFSG